MKKHQSSYDNIVLYFTSITWRFAGTFYIALCMQPLTAIYITHWERGLLPYTLYSNLSSHALWRKHTSYDSVLRAPTMTLCGRRVRMHVYIYCGPHVCYHLLPLRHTCQCPTIANNPPIGLAAFPRLGMLWEIIHFLVTSSSALLYLGFCFVVLINDMVS